MYLSDSRRFGITWYMERSEDIIAILLFLRLRVISFHGSIYVYPLSILKGSLHTPSVLNPSRAKCLHWASPLP